MISGDRHPRSAPKEMATRRATTAGKKRPRPLTSKGTRRASSRLRGTSRMAATAPRMPMGTLTKKMRRHPPAATSKPPTVGPSARPRAWAAPWKPMARPSERAGTTSTMMARLLACSMAAPTAWSARNPHRAARLGGHTAQDRGDHEEDEPVDVEQLAAPHVGDPAHGGDGPHQHHQVADSPTQVTAPTLTWNERWMDGRATVTMLASRWLIRAPMHTAATANHGASRGTPGRPAAHLGSISSRSQTNVHGRDVTSV